MSYREPDPLAFFPPAGRMDGTKLSEVHRRRKAWTRVQRQVVEWVHPSAELSPEDKWLNEWLPKWGDWMRAGGGAKGYPGGSVGFQGAYIRSWDDLEENDAKRIISALDATIDGLALREKQAVYFAHGLTTEVPNDFRVFDAFAEARASIMARVRKILCIA